MLSREEMLEDFYHYLDSAGHLFVYERDIVPLSDEQLREEYDRVFVEGEKKYVEEGDESPTEEEMLMMGFFG